MSSEPSSNGSTVSPAGINVEVPNGAPVPSGNSSTVGSSTSLNSVASSGNSPTVRSSNSLNSVAPYAATAAAYQAAMANRVDSLKGEIDGKMNIDQRVKRRLQQLENMLSKVQAQMKGLGAGAAKDKESILDGLRKEGFTVSLEKEQEAALKEADMLLAGKYLNIFGDLYYTTLITPLEDSIGLSKAQSWNHLGLQSLNQFIINYNINAALGDDLGRTLEIFLRVFGADAGAAAAAAPAPAPATAANTTGAPNATSNTEPSGPVSKLECTVTELRYLIPPLRHRMLTLKSQARLFTLNAGANSRMLTPNAHHYLDIAEKIGVFLAGAVKKCGITWNTMGAAAVAAAPEPAPQSMINDDLMAKINDIHEYIKRMEAADAAKAPVEPSTADLTREYLMQRFLDYQMLREDARSWLNKKLLKAVVAAQFNDLEAKLAAANPAVATQLENIENVIRKLVDQSPTSAELNNKLGEIRSDIDYMIGQLDESLRTSAGNALNTMMNSIDTAFRVQASRAEAIATDTQAMIQTSTDNIRGDIATINAQLSQLAEQRTANEATIRGLTEEMNRLREEMNAIITRNQQLSDENNRLQGELVRIQDELTQAATDNEALTAALEAATTQYATATAAIAAQLAERTEQKDEAVRERDAARAAAEAAAAAARVAAEAAERERDAARATIRALRTAADAARTDAAIAASTAVTTLAAANGRAAVAQARVAELEAELLGLRAEMAAQTTRHSAELQRIAAALPQDSTGNIIQRIEALTTELNTLREQLATARQDLDAANASNAELTRQFEAAQATNARLTDDITRLQDELRTAQTTGSNASGALATARTNLTTKDTEIADLRRQLEDCSGTVASLTRELANARDAGVQAVAALRAQLGEASAAMDGVQAALNAANADKLDLQAEVARLQQQIATLERSLTAKTTEFERATSEIARLNALLAMRAEITPAQLESIQAAKATAERDAAAASDERDALAAQLDELGTSRGELAALREVKRTVDQLVYAFSRAAEKETRSTDMMRIAKTMYNTYKTENLRTHLSGDYYSFATSNVNTLKTNLYKSIFTLPYITNTNGVVYPPALFATFKRYFAYSTFEDDQVMLFELLIALSNKKLITATNFDKLLINMYFAVIRATRYASFFEAADRGETEAVKDTQALLESRGIIGIDYRRIKTPNIDSYFKYIKV